MEHNTDRILWTVLILVIGVALYIGFRPAANGLLHQIVDKTQAVATNVNSNTSDSSSSKSNSSSSSHNTVNPNLIKGTSSDFQTASDSPHKNYGGFLHHFSSDELSSLAGNQVTARVFIHNTTTHTVNLMIYTDGGGGRISLGTDVPAGTDGYSTVTAYNITSSDTWGDISIRAYKDNAAISGVQYKEFKLEKGSVATPWVP